MEYNRKNVYTALTAKKLKSGDMVIAADNMSDLEEMVKHNNTYTHVIYNILLPKFEARFEVVGEDMRAVRKHLVYLVERADEPIKYEKDTTSNEDTMVSSTEFDEERLYTDGNADKLNVGDKVIAADTLIGIKNGLKEVIPNIKEIVLIDKENMSYRFVVRDRDGTKYSTLLAYLVEKVKPEENKSINHSDYRPFNDIQELIDTWYSKLIFYSNPSKLKYLVPTIRVQNSIGCIRNITCFDTENNCVYFSFDNPSGCPNTSYTMKELFDRFTFLDGSPCGICIKS